MPLPVTHAPLGEKPMKFNRISWTELTVGLVAVALLMGISAMFVQWCG